MSRNSTGTIIAAVLPAGLMVRSSTTGKINQFSNSGEYLKEKRVEMDQTMKPNILGVIPVRGGSKSVPRKNLAPLNGKPMMYYTIQAAQDSNWMSHFVVSAEDEEIIRVAKDRGAPAPFVRPAELATDEAPSLPVVQHAVRFMESSLGIVFDYVVLLQATSVAKIGRASCRERV